MVGEQSGKLGFKIAITMKVPQGRAGDHCRRVLYGRVHRRSLLGWIRFE